MSGTGLESILPQLAGNHLVGFMLVLARVGPLFLLAPVFSGRFIPVRAKLAAAAAISLALSPLAEEGQKLPGDVALLALTIMKEAIVGIAFALAIGAIGAAVQAGASILDTLIGFSFSALVDPVTNMQNAILGQVYALFTALVFVVTGGDQIMIGGLAKTYSIVPLGDFPSAGTFSALAMTAFVSVFTIGLQIAAPVVIALLVADAAFAIVAKAVPQMNVFAVGLPAKILLGFAVVGASLPFVATHVQADLENAVMGALSTLAK